MELSLLGQPAATTADGRRVALPPGRPARLITALALERGRVLDRDELVAAVWEDSAPQSVRNALHVYVSRLRSLLGSGAILTAGTGYRLTLAEDAIDVHRFGSLLDDGSLAIRTGLVHRGIALLAEAIAVYRGPLLAGEALSTSLATARRRLAERHELACEDLLAARLLVATPPEAPALVPQARHLVDEAPFREERHLLLMQALELAGRGSEALEAYEAARLLLRDRLGSAPGRDLRAARDRLAGARPPTTTTTGGPTLLPHPVGRGGDLDHLVELVLGRRLVTVTGPAGCGTTRLAQEALRVVAPMFEGRVVEVSMDGPDDPVGAMAERMGATAIRDPWSAVAAGLAHRSLMVLDACDDPSLVPVVRRLLTDCPEATVLVTAQRPLGIAGEVVVRLAGLDAGAHNSPDVELVEAPGVQLYLQRAREAGHPVPTDRVREVSSLVRRLGGLPHAIELAAAHPDGGRPHLLLERPLLEAVSIRPGGATAESGRDSGYLHSINRAVRHLSPRARTTLALLCQLPEVPDGLVAAASDRPDETQEAIDELVAWSLVSRPESGTPVVRVSDLLRQVVLHSDLPGLAGAPSPPSDMRAAVRAALASQSEALLWMPLAIPVSVEASVRVQALHAVALASLEWPDPWPSESAHAQTLLLLLDADLDRGGRDRLVRDLDTIAADSLGPDLRYDLRRARLGFALAAADPDALARAAAEIDELAPAADPLRQCAWAVDRVFLALERGDVEEAHELAELAWARVVESRASDGPLGVRASRARMHAARLHVGLEAGVRLALEAAAIADRIDCAESISAFGEAAEILVDGREVELGSSYTRRAARLALRWSSPHSLVYALSLADIALSRGDLEECRAVTVALLERVRRSGDDRYQKWCLIRLSQAAHRADDHKHATVLLGASSTISPGTAWDSDPDVCDLLESLPAALGGAAFREAFDRGASAPHGWVTAVLDEPVSLPESLDPELTAALRRD